MLKALKLEQDSSSPTAFKGPSSILSPSACDYIQKAFDFCNSEYIMVNAVWITKDKLCHVTS